MIQLHFLISEKQQCQYDSFFSGVAIIMSKESKTAFLIRCGWVDPDNQLYVDYHDHEWGVPVHDDRKHFEFLILEGAQAGLSWITILKRREGYRKAFCNFDPKKVARFDEAKMAELLLDNGIIRNRLKIASAVNNAKRFLEVQKEFGSFDAYIWQFVGGKPMCNQWKTIKEIPSASCEAITLSGDLKKRGFTFVGPVVIYAHMQATGLVNDHTIDCFCYQKKPRSNGT
ncbi:MAG TPA: DNA-3-methyladenine glycosylase I [Chlamydiales bacterium]|nr:DNA-3-methyladenine glycosylase I [Chlamydiales bacterium]